MKVYEEIYNIVAENYHDAGMSFAYRKTTFLQDVNSHPQKIDVSQYVTLPNELFFQAIFVAAFKRLPEAEEAKRWKTQLELPKECFQRKFLKYIARSSVVAINHILLVNNPYFEQKRGLRYRFMGILYGLTDKSSLREFGKMLPAPIQKIIRKVFL